MHPVLWNCNRVLNLFTSYIRWKLKSVSVRFVPYVGTNQPGSLMMAFTSCIQDGGPDGCNEVLEATMMDLPGAVSCSLGFPSTKETRARMGFIDAFDWSFTCRAGIDVNEIYQGALVVALTGGPDLFRSSGGNVYLGKLLIDYEIALAEPASTLSLLRPAVKSAWNAASITQNSPVEINFGSNSGVKPGDILALPWYPPGQDPNVNNVLKFADGVGTNTKSPGMGDTVYVRAAGNPTADGTTIGRIYPTLSAAQAAPASTSILNAGTMYLRNTSSQAVSTTDWVQSGINLAKVILPTLIETAATILL